MLAIELAGTGDIVRLRDTIRRFVAREMPREKAWAWDRDGIYPRKVVQKLAGLGVMGLAKG
jgi:alkylation response protein AidB-like acyl-CoA dehydrogenase